MTVETEISTPIDDVEADTSAIVEPETVETETDTSTAEPVNETEIAETETESTTPPQTLYAGKYNTIEDLEKGYLEAQKSFNQVAELRKQIEDMNRAQAEKEQRAQLEMLQKAQQRGFDTVEAQQIADHIQVAELEYYASNMNLVNPQDYEQVSNLLNTYYATGYKAYLDEAKRFFPSDFIERVATTKNQLEANLKGQFEARNRAMHEQHEQELANLLKTDFAEFLADVNTNSGKAKALKSFCDVGSINSKDDMQVFLDIYNEIAKYERDLAIKEYEAKKAIDETKQKAVIDAGANVATPPQGLKESYTQAEVNAMHNDEFSKLYDKYGLEFTNRIR